MVYLYERNFAKLHPDSESETLDIDRVGFIFEDGKGSELFQNLQRYVEHKEWHHIPKDDSNYYLFIIKKARDYFKRYLPTHVDYDVHLYTLIDLNVAYLFTFDIY